MTEQIENQIGEIYTNIEDGYSVRPKTKYEQLTIEFRVTNRQGKVAYSRSVYPTLEKCVEAYSSLTIGELKESVQKAKLYNHGF